MRPAAQRLDLRPEFFVLPAKMLFPAVLQVGVRQVGAGIVHGFGIAH